jgi:hypothetical protein
MMPNAFGTPFPSFEELHARATAPIVPARFDEDVRGSENLLLSQFQQGLSPLQEQYLRILHGQEMPSTIPPGLARRPALYPTGGIRG